MLKVMAWLAIGCPLRSSRVAVSVWVVPGTFGPALAGARVRVAPKRLLRTWVVNWLETGPYWLPLASCQLTWAVSVSGPAAWPAGTGKVAVALALSPGPSVAG